MPSLPSQDRKDPIADAADAVTLNQDVQWDRCAKLTAPGEHWALDNLRALARIFAASPAADPESSVAARSNPYGGTLVWWAVRLLIAVSAVEVAATLVLLPWEWDDYYREHGQFAVFLAMMLAAHTTGACLLLYAGRRDHRIWLFGVHFLLWATLVPAHMLPIFLWEIPPPRELHLPLYLYPFTVAPAFLWAFAREFPRVHRRTRLDDVARRMVAVSATVGCAIWLVWSVTPNLARSGQLPQPVFFTLADICIAAMNLLVLSGVVVIALRAHAAPADEARRVALFSGAILLWMGLATVYDIVEVFSPGVWGSDYRWTPGNLLIDLGRVAAMIMLWYAVLAKRVPDLRAVVRVSYRRLLMHRLLGLAALAPPAVLAWVVASRPERRVGAVIADPLVQWLVAATAILLLVVAWRERLLTRLDAWLYPETTEQRHALAMATAALAQTARLATIDRIVIRAVRRGCVAPATLLIASGAAETDGQTFSAPEGSVVPLARASSIVHVLETTRASLRVDPGDGSSAFEWLPPDEAAWVVSAAAASLVPVLGSGAAVLGILVVGRRFDEQLVRPVAMPFLEVLAAAAGVALERLRLPDVPATRPEDAPPARECPVCRVVTAAGERRRCDCGPAYVETACPRFLAGKFRLTRRLGTGGMGAVYLARDVALAREVAVKTLVGTSRPGLVGLKTEARAMATVAHSAIAQIYGIESWRGRPFLVAEFLAGGTLADWLARGPLPAKQAVAVTAALADALAALHETGYLHGDVKPSNIGFTAAGSPKLLDFGLARLSDDAAPLAGGTVSYLSPEVLSGRPADEGNDLWSLCVVLYEMVSGRHPFAGVGVDEVIDRIRHQRLSGRAGPAGESAPSSEAVAFAASILTAQPSARPATARAFAAALDEVGRPEQ